MKKNMYIYNFSGNSDGQLTGCTSHFTFVQTLHFTRYLKMALTKLISNQN